MMADPLAVATNLVSRILSRVKDAKTSKEECSFLGKMAEQTLRVLKNVETREFSDTFVTTTIELVHAALMEAGEAIEKCSNASIFSALLWHDHYSMPLQNAASNLHHALSQLSLASSGMTANIQSNLDALSLQLRQAETDKRNAIAQQTHTLKKELEKGFYQQSQGNQEAKRLIRELIEGRTLMIQDLGTELEMLNEASRDAKVKKATQMEHELKQVIEALSESMAVANQDQVFVPSLTKALCCPISEEIMRDPVLLKESGRIYDRSSITKKLEQGRFYEPITKEELVSLDFVRCYALRDVCHAFLGRSADSSTVVGDSKTEDLETWFAPGVYEGHGKISTNDSEIYVVQLLILEPNGTAVTCTLYRRENHESQSNGIEIGGGEWDHRTLHLSYGDILFAYNGEVNQSSNQTHAVFVWIGKALEYIAHYKEHGSIFVYSLPPLKTMVAIYPTILEMESETIAVSNGIQCISKLVVSLEIDFNIGGFLWFKSRTHKRKSIGSITRGNWASNGILSFEVCFTNPSIKLNSYETPTNYLACFQVSGGLTRSTTSSVSRFSAKFLKTKDKGMTLSDQSTSVLPRNGDVFEWHHLREASTHWHNLHQKPLKLFQVIKSTPRYNAPSLEKVYE